MLAALLLHHPLILDDTKTVANPALVAQTIMTYTQAEGRIRGRAADDRSVALGDIRECRGVLRPSGEQPVTSFTEAGGTRGRAICVTGYPFGDDSPQTGEVVKQLKAGLRANYGWAGSVVVGHLIDH